MKKLIIVLFFSIQFAPLKSEVIYVHIIGPSHVCPGSNIYTYYLDSDQGGGIVTWTIENGLIKNPCTGQWVGQFQYNTTNPNCSFSDDYPQEIKFNNNGNQAHIYVTKVNGIVHPSSEKTVLQEPPPSQAWIWGDEKLMNCGSYSNMYNLSGLSDGWKLYFWNVGSGLTKVSQNGNQINIKPASSGTSGPKTLGAKIIWVDPKYHECGARNVNNKTITVVPPTLRVTGETQICPGELYQYYAKFDGAAEPVPGASYSWIYPPGYQSLNGTSSYMLHLQSPLYNLQGGPVRATVILTCGNGGTYIDGITIYPSCYVNYSYSVSPIPTNDEITIELKSKVKQDNIFKSKDTVVLLIIQNDKGAIKLSKELEKEKEILDLKTLKPDIYYLKVFINDHQIGDTERILKN